MADLSSEEIAADCEKIRVLADLVKTKYKVFDLPEPSSEEHEFAKSMHKLFKSISDNNRLIHSFATALLDLAEKLLVTAKKLERHRKPKRNQARDEEIMQLHNSGKTGPAATKAVLR